jgi:hypothetical protein
VYPSSTAMIVVRVQAARVTKESVTLLLAIGFGGLGLITSLWLLSMWLIEQYALVVIGD